MTYYQEQVRYHVEKAEYWKNIVTDAEIRAEQEAERRMRGRLGFSRSKTLTRGDIAYATKRVLDNNLQYSAAVANRNSHQTQATMYALAELATRGYTT